MDTLVTFGLATSISLRLKSNFDEIANIHALVLL